MLLESNTYSWIIIMKLTKKQLRKLIREMAWDPKLVDKSMRQKTVDYVDDQGEYVLRPMTQSEYSDFVDTEYIGDESRAYGLLSFKEGEKEKQILRDYHRINKVEISKFHKEIMSPSGAVTCMHSPGYVGTAGKREGKGLGAVDWIEKFGKSRHQISVCMFPFSIENMYKASLIDLGENSEEVFYDHSIILGGFPTLMNSFDMWTQTLSTAHPDLVKFQQQSGLTKSSGRMPDIDNLQKFISESEPSEETVLANYFVKGIHAPVEDSNNLSDNVKELFERCRSKNIPLYVSYLDNLTTKRVI